MKKYSPRTPLASLVVALLSLALLATACGAETERAQSAGERTATSASELAIAPPPTAAAADVAATDGAPNPQHGLTLDEWVKSSPTKEDGVLLGGESSPRPAREGYATVDWSDLIPPGQSAQEVYEKFEQQLLEVEYGSKEADELYAAIEAEFDTEAVNTELDGQNIRLAGFVAPLTFDDEVITEFLLVPNFGACIHVPAPPPNQTIMVTVEREDGLTIKESWGAVWVEGTLTAAPATTDLATASYTFTGATSGVYQGF